MDEFDFDSLASELEYYSKIQQDIDEIDPDTETFKRPAKEVIEHLPDGTVRWTIISSDRKRRGKVAVFKPFGGRHD